MSMRQLAREYQVTPNHVYQVLYDLEAKRVIEPKRSGKFLRLTSLEISAIEKELQRRGFVKGE